MKLRWLAHNFLLLPLAWLANSKVPFQTGWHCVFFHIFNRAGWLKTVRLLAGIFISPEVLLVSNVERVFFSQEK